MPSTLFQFVLLVGVFAPGYLWVRATERRRSRPERSGLFEAAELAVVGVWACAAALAITALISSLVPGVFAEPQPWASLGWAYARAHLVESLGPPFSF